MVVAFRNGTDKNNSWRTVFDHKLFRVRVNDSLWLFAVFALLPISILVALKSQFPKKVIDIAQVVERASKRFFTIHSFRLVESRIRILHAVHWLYWLRFLKGRLACIKRIATVWAWAVIRHFGAHFGLIEVIEISKLAAFGLVGLTAVVLKGTGSLSYARLLLERIFRQLLDWFQILVIYSSQIIVLELYMFQFRMENVHLAAILKNDFIIKLG